MSTENALLSILLEKINGDTLVLPTLPKVAIKVRQASEDPDVNLTTIANIISQDPALSMRIMKIANSAYLGRSVQVGTLSQAVTRIGLRQIKNIATALAVEQLFVSRNEIVSEYLAMNWTKTVNIAAGAIAMTRFYLAENKHSSLNMETITLAALVHNIGLLPILSEAENFPHVFANPTFLDSAIEKLSGRIGGSIMRAWGFSKEFIEVAEFWHDLSHDTETVGYMDFVRLSGAWKNAFAEERRCKIILAQGVERGMIPSVEFLSTPDFKETVESIRSVFS